MVTKQFAKRWNLPPEAAAELEVLYKKYIRESSLQGGSESEETSAVRLELSREGVVMWRNNVGVASTPSGRPIRYGLANDSSATNKHYKSGDLIGIRPVIITSDMVGSTIGQFVSREIKKSGWRYAGTEREEAQMRWAEVINTRGGDAKIG